MYICMYRHMITMYAGVFSEMREILASSLCKSQESLARISVMSQNSKQDPRSSFDTFFLPAGLLGREVKKTVVLLVSVHVFQSLKESEIVTIKVGSIHMTFPFYLHYPHYIPLMSPCLPCLPLGTQGAILGRTSPWWSRSTQSYTTRKLKGRLWAVTWQFGETTEFPMWLQWNDGRFWTN